ncbi:MAG: YpdA family putative bacillithiol disulfide reductase [Rhodothermales bacterium]
MYDVIIIGAGPVGLACGISARREGLSSLLIEKGALVNSLLDYPTNMEFFSTPELLEIGDHPFTTRGIKPTREEGIDYYRRIADVENLSIKLYERVTGLEGRAGHFTVATDKGRYACRNVVIVTGFYDIPNALNVPGETLPKVTHYFREPYPYSQQHVAVIGAKNSAAKAALQCHRAGARVTLVVRDSQVSDKIKYWIKPDLENRIKEGAIAAYFNSRVESIAEKTITLQTPEGITTLENDWVLAMTGYRPDYRFLESLGVTIAGDEHRTPIHDPNTFETERKGLFMAGTVCGGLRTSRWFIENGRHHAQLIMQYIARGVVGDASAIPDPVAENVQ